MNPERRARIVVAALIFAATALAYLPVLDNGFVNFDDDEYVTDQPLVRDGLTVRAVRAAFGATEAANWHPLTWISHQIDVSLWGMSPKGHHATSLLLHALAAVLLFLFLERRTSAVASSGLAAALFALHPLHVESVAWVAERKDVLSTLFWILALAAWARWTDRAGTGRYVVALALFAAGLLAKPMLVTLPLTLVLIDVWPLRRLDPARPVAGLGRLLREKIPFFALSVGASVVTVYAQRAGGSWGSLDQYPAPARVGNAVISATAYLGQALWPAGLSVFYPHPGAEIQVAPVALAAVVLAALSALAFRAYRVEPAVPVGWCWYLVTLVPVLGIVQVGEQARADRYTYVPLIGIFVASVWGGARLFARWLPEPRRRAARAAAVATGLLVLTGCAVATWMQAQVWRDSITLFEHALAVTERNHVAHINLALALAARGEPAKAADHYTRALTIRPDSATAHNNLGRIRFNDGRLDEAITHYRAAIAHDPRRGEAHSNLGLALARQGKVAESLPEFTTAVRLMPRSAEVRFNLGTALAALGRTTEATEQFRTAIAVDPGFGPAHSSLAASLFLAGDYPGAWREIRLARAGGSEPPAALLERLSRFMPEPR